MLVADRLHDHRGVGGRRRSGWTRSTHRPRRARARCPRPRPGTSCGSRSRAAARRDRTRAGSAPIVELPAGLGGGHEPRRSRRFSCSSRLGSSVGVSIGRSSSLERTSQAGSIGRGSSRPASTGASRRAAGCLRRGHGGSRVCAGRTQPRANGSPTSSARAPSTLTVLPGSASGARSQGDRAEARGDRGRSETPHHALTQADLGAPLAGLRELEPAQVAIGLAPVVQARHGLLADAALGGSRAR